MSGLFDAEPVAPEAREPEPDLPPLHGSVEQCRWAHHVRAELLPQCRGIVRQHEQYAELLERQGRHDRAVGERLLADAGARRLEELRAITAAGWWLDRRKNSPVELMTGAPAKPGPAAWRKGGAS